LLRNPTEFLVRQRARHGDSFVLDAFGHRLFCVFSPAGVRSLYAQPEEQASFGMATYTLIKSKVPIELLLGRRNHPKSLFGNAKIETYLDNLGLAVAQEIDRLGPSGSFEVFAEMRGWVTVWAWRRGVVPRRHHPNTSIVSSRSSTGSTVRSPSFAPTETW
jgi:hypothetical protein